MRPGLLNRIGDRIADALTFLIEVWIGYRFERAAGMSRRTSLRLAWHSARLP